MSLSRSVLATTFTMILAANSSWAEEPLTLKGHTKEVTAVIVAPDGKSVVSAALDGKVRIWEMPSGKVLHVLDADPKGVYALALSKDGKHLASAGTDKLIRLWDPATGKEVRQLKGHDDQVAALAFSVDGKLLASGGYDHVIRLWDPIEGKNVRTLDGHEGRVTGLAFSPNGKLLASAAVGKAQINVGGNFFSTGTSDFVRLWKVDGKDSTKFQTRGANVAFSADGAWLVTGGLVPDIQMKGGGVSLDGLDQTGLIEMATGNEKTTIKWRGQAVAFAPKDGKFATGAGSHLHFARLGVIAYNGVNVRNMDNRVRVWDTTGKELLCLPEKSATALAFSPNGESIVTGTWKGDVVVWSLPTK
jgi:WD40 repeat protein